MLYVALALIAAACVSLVIAVTVAPMLAWVSVACSVLGIVLVAIARRQQPVLEDQQVTGDVDRGSARGTFSDRTTEPAEEDTDVADFLVVSELADEVLVVDEHPRYHLADCFWLSGQRSVRLRVDKARRLGFTPCVNCAPDTVLAARHRGLS